MEELTWEKHRAVCIHQRTHHYHITTTQQSRAVGKLHLSHMIEELEIRIETFESIFEQF